MSRKKKKKQRQLEQNKINGSELNGWNCPAVEIEDNQQDELEDDIDEEVELEPMPEAADIIEPMTPPELAFVMDRSEEEQYIVPREVIEMSAETTSAEEDEPVQQAEALPVPDSTHGKQISAYLSKMSSYLSAQFRSRRETAENGEIPAESTSVEEEETVQQAEAVIVPQPEQQPEAVQETETVESFEAEQLEVAEQAETVEQAEDSAETETVPDSAHGKQIAAYLSKMSSYLSAQPRSKQEIAEDNEKFGGLQDEPDTATEEKQNPLLALKTSFALRRKQEEKTDKTVVYTTKSGFGELLDRLRSNIHEIFDWAFEECYYIGTLLIRYCSDMRRQVFRAWTWLKYTVPPFLSAKRHQMGRMLDNLTDSSLEPFRDITGKTRSMRYRLANRTESGENGQRVSAVRIIAGYVYSLGRPINKIANFLLPILGCAVLAATILYFQQVNYALSVEYDGVKLGYIERESDFYEAQKLMYQRLMGEQYVAPEDNRPTFKLVIADPENVMDVDTLTNKIMAISKLDVVTADGIFIDGAFLGAVDDGSEFLLYIDSILESYRTDTEHERVQFVKKVTLQEGIYPETSLKPVFEIKNSLESNETLPQTHVVAEGETMETLAEDNNTTVDAIIKLNPKLQQRVEESQVDVPTLITGDEILVSKVELSLGIQVTRRETYTESIDYGIDYIDVDNMPESWTSTVTSGIRGEVEIVSDIVYIDGERITETELSRTIIDEPVNAQVKRGTLKPAQYVSQVTGGASNSFMWPVNGGYVSVGLYGYPGHTGMDIAAPAGTGIYASSDGVVSYAVNYTNGAYGKRVDISHSGGIMTRYAHCSEVLVKSGQQVTQGQLIAKVGRTGNAYGNHCHFEVRVNGAVMNPKDFVGGYFPGYQ